MERRKDKMKPKLLIIIFSIVMLIFLYFLDLYPIIQTPFTQYGMNHWIPEYIAMILIGYLIADGIESLLSKTMVFCVILYPILVELFSKGTIMIYYGIFVGCVFSSAMLIGMLIRKLEKVKKCKSNIK